MLHVTLHPMVLVMISDFYTKARVLGNKGTNPETFGFLLGTQTGRDVHIMTAFGAKLNSDTEIDFEWVGKRVEQLKYFYSKYEKAYDILGWYATGRVKQAIHEQMTHSCVAREMFGEPLFLMVDCAPPPECKSLPAQLFETSVTFEGTNKTLTFKRIPYFINSDELERVAVENIVHTKSTGADVSTLKDPVRTLKDAVSMLNSRVEILVEYLAAVKRGEIQPDRAMLRRISSICSKLPTADSRKFQQEYDAEFYDITLILFINLLTRGAHQLHDLIERYSKFEHRSFRRRGI